MFWALLGILAAAVAIAWYFREQRRQAGEAAGLCCPDCGGDLRGYEQSPTCPHCYAILAPGDDEEEDAGEPDSVDEVDDDYDTSHRW